MISTVIDNESRSPQQIQQEVRKILSELGIGSNAQIFVYEMSDDRDNVEINVEATELRDEDMKRALNERLEDLG
jgi:signal transduction histidine kinase